MPSHDSFPFPFSRRPACAFTLRPGRSLFVKLLRNVDVIYEPKGKSGCYKSRGGVMAGSRWCAVVVLRRAGCSAAGKRAGFGARGKWAVTASPSTEQRFDTKSISVCIFVFASIRLFWHEFPLTMHAWHLENTVIPFHCQITEGSCRRWQSLGATLVHPTHLPPVPARRRGLRSPFLPLCPPIIPNNQIISIPGQKRRFKPSNEK